MLSSKKVEAWLILQQESGLFHFVSFWKVTVRLR